MIILELKAIGFGSDLSHYIAYFQSEDKAILPVSISRLSAPHFEVDKTHRDKTLYGTINAVCENFNKKMHYIHFLINEEEAVENTLVISDENDIFLTNTREIPISIDAATGLHYFYDLPIKMSESMGFAMIPINEIDSRLKDVIENPDKILDI